MLLALLSSTYKFLWFQEWEAIIHDYKSREDQLRKELADSRQRYDDVLLEMEQEQHRTNANIRDIKERHQALIEKWFPETNLPLCDLIYFCIFLLLFQACT